MIEPDEDHLEKLDIDALVATHEKAMAVVEAADGLLASFDRLSSALMALNGSAESRETSVHGKSRF